MSQLKTKFMWDQHRIGEKIYSNDSGQLLFFISSPEPKAHGELIVYQSSRRPSVRPWVVRPHF